MNNNRRLKALEQAVKQKNSSTTIIVFRDRSNGIISIPLLNFIGSIQEGEEIISEYQKGNKIVIFNIPRPKHKRYIGDNIIQ